jgi:hypothetical protein
MDAEIETTGDLMSERRAVVLQVAEERGLLGANDRIVGSRMPDALVEQAKRASGIAGDDGTPDLCTRPDAIEDDFAERLMARKGQVPRGTLFAG